MTPEQAAELERAAELIYPIEGEYSPRSDDPWEKESDEEEGWISKLIRSIKSNSALVPAILVFITAVYYIYIFRYYSAFFERLSIPLTSINLPFTFYLSAGIRLLPWIMLIPFVIAGIILVHDMYQSVKILLFLRRSSKFFEFKRRISETNTKSRQFDKILFYIFVPAILFFLLAFYPSFQGNLDAENLIRGSGSPEITVTWNEYGVNLTDGNLIFIVYNEKNYYFVEKNILAPLHPKSYIIPDTQIKMITFR